MSDKEEKYFYVLCRDGQIIEVRNRQETFDAIMGAMLNKGIIALKDYGTILNGVDISKVLREDQYDAWISSTTPKEYIKDGTWRDGKEKKVIRYEKWKQEEIDSRMKLDAPNDDAPHTSEEYKELFAKYRPAWFDDWKKRNDEIIPPHEDISRLKE